MPRVADKVAARECRLYARYLIGVTPETDIVARYRRARGIFGFDSTDRLESLVQRVPFLLGAADAGCGLLRKEHPLRRKLLLLTAILEATPDHADRFLLSRRSYSYIYLELFWLGIRTGLKAAVGIPLVLLMARP